MGTIAEGRKPGGKEPARRQEMRKTGAFLLRSAPGLLTFLFSRPLGSKVQGPNSGKVQNSMPNDQMGKIGPLAGSTELAELGS